MRATTKSRSLWLIGAGSMAREYSRVLLALGRTFTVVGRSERSAAAFEKAVDVPVHRGGLTSALIDSDPPDMAIVAVGVDQLATATSQLVEAGCRRVLVEKPAGINSEEIRLLQTSVERTGAIVQVAYNRRHYASVVTARRMITEDGGITSCLFEVTERSESIAELDKSQAEKASWFLANTSHVVDLVISLAGRPVELVAHNAGTLPWHQSGSQFVGAGLTERGVPFSYHGDWEAPGRWGIEVCTRERRLVFRPIEELHMIVRGSETIVRVDIDDRLDREYKPGLFLQTVAFLEEDDRVVCKLADHHRNCEVYDQIAGYQRSNSVEALS